MRFKVNIKSSEIKNLIEIDSKIFIHRKTDNNNCNEERIEKNNQNAT